MDAETLEQQRVNGAIKVALESLLAARLEGDLLERRMRLAASFAGTLSHELPGYQVGSVVTDEGELRVQGRKENAGEAGDQVYVLNVTLVLPDHIKALVVGEE